MRRRVVVTGIGLVTPIGNDLESTWSSLLAGKNGAGPITLFDVTDYATKFGCEVKGCDASKWFDKRELKHVDRFLNDAARTECQELRPRGLIADAGEKDHGDVARICVRRKLAEDRRTIDVGHDDIQKNEVGSQLASELHATRPALRFVDLEMRRERERGDAPDIFFIVDDQNFRFGRHHSIPVRTTATRPYAV